MLLKFTNKIAIYIGVSILIALVINFGLFLYKGFFLSPDISNSIVGDFGWIEKLIHSNNSVLVNKKSGIYQIFLNSDLFKSFLNWYPFNLIVLGALSYISKISVMSVFVYITYQLKILFTALQSKDIFTNRNIKYIENIAKSLIILFLLKLIFVFKFQISWILFSLLLFVLSNIFKYGLKIETDNKLTI